MKLPVTLLMLILNSVAFAGDARDTRPLALNMNLSNSREWGKNVSVREPLSAPKFDDHIRSALPKPIQISPNCQIEVEIVSHLDRDIRSITVFTWLFMADRERKQPAFDPTVPPSDNYREAWRKYNEEQTRLCGDLAGRSLFTAHLKVPDRDTGMIMIDSDILHGKVERIDLSQYRLRMSFSDPTFRGDPQRPAEERPDSNSETAL